MNVKITVTELEPWDCECCGTVYNSEAKIEYEDGRVTELSYDTHFGGDWDGTKEQLYREVLEELDIDVEINYEQEGEEYGS